MRKMIGPGLAVALIGVVAISGIATAAQPKPLGFYVGRTATLQASKGGHTLAEFFGTCTLPEKHSKYLFSVTFRIPVNSKGEFHWSRKNAVNTPDGGTLLHTSRVTIDGKFVSRKEAKGSYQLHKGSCKKFNFDVKLQK